MLSLPYSLTSPTTDEYIIATSRMSDFFLDIPSFLDRIEGDTKILVQLTFSGDIDSIKKIDLNDYPEYKDRVTITCNLPKDEQKHEEEILKEFLKVGFRVLPSSLIESKEDFMSYLPIFQDISKVDFQVGGDIMFNLKLLKQLKQEFKGIRFRYTLDDCVGNYEGIHNFFLLPEGIALYSPTIDYFMFHTIQGTRQEVLKDVFFREQTWPYQLFYLYGTNCGEVVKDSYLLEALGDFSKVRSECQKRCSDIDICGYCQSVVDLIEVIKKKSEEINGNS